MEPAWSNDEDSHVGARAATGKVGQVKGDDSRRKGVAWSCVLGVDCETDLTR